jgi:anti-sigma factor RsiW
MNGCRRVSPLLEPFADGELAADKTIEVEQHLGGCPRCAAHVRLNGALRASVRQVVRDSAAPSMEFQQRVAAALAAERERTWDRPSVYDGRVLPWRVIVPLAAAAAVILVSAAAVNPPASSTRRAEAAPTSLATSVDRLLDDLVSYHARATEPEVRELAAFRKREPEVGLPFRIPTFQEYGARWEGGSVVPLETQRAASLRYRLGSHRFTLYVYDSNRFPLRARLEPRVVREMPVYVGTRHGYSIAATEQRGVGYAAATDFDDQETAELVASTVVH